MRIAVLGSGMVGAAMALDLATQHQVKVFDVSESNLRKLQQRNPAIEVQVADLRLHQHFAAWFKDADLVLVAVPGFMGFETVRAVIEAGKTSLTSPSFLKTRWRWIPWLNQKG